MIVSLNGPEALVKEFSSLFTSHKIQPVSPSTEIFISLSEETTPLQKISSSCFVLHSALTHTVTETASQFQNPERIVGIGFLPGFSRNATIELSRGLKTNDATIERAQEFISSLEKKPVLVPDIVGLVAPRTIAMLINEASFALGEQVASIKDIDNAMKLGTNYPHGPFEWCDEVGAEIVVAILDALHRELGDDRYRVAPRLHAKARANEKFY